MMPFWFAPLSIVPSVVVLLVSSSLSEGFVAVAVSEDESSPSSSRKDPYRSDSSSDFDPLDENWDWGSYYDPQNEFCGSDDCYKILGFDYESFGRHPPGTKEITKRYRSLSRAWHPDKNPRKGAKERFVKIAKAYEVLTDEQRRLEYDALRSRPDEYVLKYGAPVLWSFAPHSDVRAIVLVLSLLASAFAWFVQKSRWQRVADRIVEAAVEDRGPNAGGSAESAEVRRKALDILAEREEEERREAASASAKKASSSNGSSDKKAQSSSSASTGGGKGGGGGGGKTAKLSARERKKLRKDALRPICAEIVNEIDDFGAGFHKPTWRDALIVKLLFLPYRLVSVLGWYAKYGSRRLRGLELNEQEKKDRAKMAAGSVAWETSTEEERQDMVKSEVWVSSANLEDWRERREVKRLSGGRQKMHARWKKKQGNKLA